MKTAHEPILETVQPWPIHKLRQQEDHLHALWDLEFKLWCDACLTYDVAKIRKHRADYETARDAYLVAHGQTQDAIYAAQMHSETD